jgi:hypothetical protein
MIRTASGGLHGTSGHQNGSPGAPVYSQASPLGVSGPGHGEMRWGETPQRNFRQVFMQPWTTADQVPFQNVPRTARACRQIAFV